MSGQKNREISGTPSDEDKKSQRQSKKSVKKSSKKKKNSSSFDNQVDMPSEAKKKKSQIRGYIDEQIGAEYDDDMNENTYNHNSQTRKKRDRKQKKSSKAAVDGNEEENHKGRVRNNGQLPMHSENHFDNGYIEYDQGDYMSEMGNHDPIDEYGEDCEMSDDDEEEPRFKYSTADLAHGNFRSQKCCLLTAGAFFILIAIAVSILMLKLPKKNDVRLLSVRHHVRGAKKFLPV
mmetsp:Transcript_6152/g.12699  ORF Transcript_6152/g.12699 Transcript_6152/m.12699 type:complete len:233 (+) Transcript_6152:102-800(+)|eukprot:CAMPEP_0197271022 /NCGR_PEP_ID=MMETSP1432-20130617/7944_1 /TAXON_ID=44447 /ORGANISM="Pseudo-nitzschia delicatissima, Strain UNC1205" /LENGTH=232 /DNA_ID=CAMNT_0042736391 /DNA_START=20 /DNA_END=718 /DNA_ORIENTATION=-